MAGISTGSSGHGGKKAVDSEIPLVPFIDLLLCTIMFLLVTAVWNQLASLEAHLDAPGTPESTLDEPPPSDLPLTVLIDGEGYRLSTELGDETRIPLAPSGEHDTVALREALQRRHGVVPNEERVVLSADDGVQYAQLVAAMDVFSGSGYPSVTVAGGF